MTKTIRTMQNIFLDAIPQDLSDKTVLDLGGFDGGYARECLNRGARKAIVVDNRQYLRYGGVQDPPPQKRVNYVEEDLMEWRDPADIVLCFNVLYHLEEPADAIWHMRTLVNEALILGTWFVEGDEIYWHRYQPLEMHPSDPTVTSMPTLNALETTAWRAGFKDIDHREVLNDRVVYRMR